MNTNICQKNLSIVKKVANAAAAILKFDVIFPFSQFILQELLHIKT